MKTYLKNVFGEKVVEIDHETGIATALQDCTVNLEGIICHDKERQVFTFEVENIEGIEDV